MTDKSKPNKTFIPPDLTKKHTADVPSMGASHAGGTEYHQYPSNNQFEVLKRADGHTQQSNITPVKNMKGLVG